MTAGRGFIQEHSPERRRAIIAEFEATWQDYPSASAAAREIATNWGIGRTTITGCLEDEGKWPSATVHQLKRLQRENERLRKENARLRAQIVGSND